MSHDKAIAQSDAASNCRLISNLNSRIKTSWRRCQADHGLEREGGRTDIRVLSYTDLHERRQRAEEFVRVAGGGVHTLSRQLTDLGYLVMLVDNAGTALNVMQSRDVEADYRKLGLVVGAQWKEKRNGTSGVGTCLVDRRSILVHRDDHFLREMSVLSCSASPIFDGQGEVIACLNATSLYQTHAKEKELVTLQLVKMMSRMTENAYFRYCYRDYYLLSISYDQMHCNDAMEALIAVDDNAEVVAINQVARAGTLWPWNDNVCGRPLSKLKIMSFEELVHGNKTDYTESCLIDNNKRSLYIRVSRGLNYLKRTYEIKPAGTKPNRKKSSAVMGLSKLSGEDEHLQKVVKRLRRVLDKDISILITGETGTGKELWAQAIHAESARASKPFVAMNCAAIPESLIESELFGYEAGSFTGAKQGGMKGKLLQAQGGTIFLDEIGDMPYELQTRLLRVLAENEVVPLGSSRAYDLDVQVISATHQSLNDKIALGEFREDLFFRLHGMSVKLQPLRQRGDLARLIEQIFQSENSGESVPIEPAALARLLAYDWPGNIRELKSAARLTLALCDGSVIDEAFLPDYLHERTGSAGVFGGPCGRDESGLRAGISEQQAIIQCLNKNKWNVKKAAAELSLSRCTLYRKMKRYQIVSPNKRCS